MTQDPNFYLVTAGLVLTSIALLGFLSLKGWREWIALKHAELKMQQGGDYGSDQGAPSASSRIEVADLKERVRKLEAIAAGIDL